MTRQYDAKLDRWTQKDDEGVYAARRWTSFENMTAWILLCVAVTDNCGCPPIHALV